MNRCEIKNYKNGFIIGRFQMLHVGHEHLINTARKQCENLLILVGSAQEKGTQRNPFDVGIRISMLKTLYQNDPNVHIGFLADLTNENDVTYEWGRYLLKNVDAWIQFYEIEGSLDAMFYGNDEEREGWFDPQDIEGIAQMKISRAEIPISATKMRNYLTWNMYDEWKKYANPKLHGFYNKLRQQLGVTI